MTPERLYQDALAAKEQGTLGMILTLPKKWNRPKGFPRGSLLCETKTGKTYNINPNKIIKWLTKNNLIDPAT